MPSYLVQHIRGSSLTKLAMLVPNLISKQGSDIPVSYLSTISIYTHVGIKI